MQAVRVAAMDINPVSATRIFENGQDTNGQSIGEYSTKPIYISKKNSPRSAGEVKENSYFFPGGYKQFKEEIGRGSQVNLRLFGDLMRDFLTPKVTITRNVLKQEVKRQENVNKKAWMEEKYKKNIFGLTQKEEQILVKTFEFEMNKIVDKA